MFSHIPSAFYESLFHASVIDLVIPEVSTSDTNPSDDDLPTWWAALEQASARNTVFFDENLVYFVSMTLPDESLAGLPGTPVVNAKEPTSEMLRFLGRLDLTMSASFVPKLPAIEVRRPPVTSISNGSLSAPPNSATLAPPTPRHPQSGAPRANPSPTNPPITPNPFPAMSSEEEHYANVDGVVVWEGKVEELKAGNQRESKDENWHPWGRRIFRRKGAWEVIWKGEIPIVYVRTNVENPVLSLTASVTLRDQNSQGKTHRKGLSLDAVSIRSGTETIRTDGTEYEDYGSEDSEAWAGMEEIDLLGGLAGKENMMPASRLPAPLRKDLFIPDGPLPSPLPLSTMTPNSAPPIVTPSTASTGVHHEKSPLPPTTVATFSSTLRKSFRRILAIAPGIRVKMNTVTLPQLLPLTSSSNGDDEDHQGETRVAIVIHLENSIEPSILHGFEISRIDITIGGKSSGITTKLLYQTESSSGSDIFPIRLGSTEQYNLFYVVDFMGERTNDPLQESIARNVGASEQVRPVSIHVIGRPYRLKSLNSDEYNYPTKTFDSSWNTSIDLTNFYASRPPSARLSLQNPPLAGNSHRPRSLNLSNPVLGDKRYNMASLVSAEQDREREGMQTRNRPMMPSQVMQNRRVVSGVRVPSMNGSPRDYGLLMSVKVLPQSSSSSPSDTIRPLVPFSIEVFVHNRTDQVRRFRLIVPGREDGTKWEARVREVLERGMKKGENLMGVGDEAFLRTSLASYLSASTPLIPLEDNIRCGPLLPGASLSARIRFLPLREGIHQIERLRVVGVGDEVDFMMGPVTDVVVGNGIDGI
ncbi:hypothetical protein LQV05_005050 [Cryptococcus neoformans]|nr:hypothetical protein J007_03249 [Cryptococcus neoformans var. grubii]OXC61252.1 hypothetical protein C358_03339 [Cryptococcus neoformans var. grubii MW-RSA852]UOH82350.1 hypothetical protein LQV05_005050 [Cryptococcus neoformans]